MIDVENRDSNIKIIKSDPPADSVLEGNAPSGSELRIYIKRDTLSAIDGYMSSDTNNELGGVLVGNLCEDSSGERYIFIKNYIHAQHTTASLSRLTFNHETWEHFDNELEKNFPDEMIIGWYHSHPGHTVFLSGHDMFIQENFFNLEFMTAYVYDPLINDRGFFYWKDGKTEKAPGYFIAGGVTAAAIPPDNHSVLDEPPEKEYKKPEDYIESPNPEFAEDNKKGGGFKTFLIVVLLLGNIVLSLFLLYQYMEIEKRTASNEQINSDIIELKENYRNLNQKLENFIIESEMKEQNKIDSMLNDTLKTDSIKIN